MSSQIRGSTDITMLSVKKDLQFSKSETIIDIIRKVINPTPLFPTCVVQEKARTCVVEEARSRWSSGPSDDREEAGQNSGVKEKDDFPEDQDVVGEEEEGDGSEDEDEDGGDDTDTDTDTDYETAEERIERLIVAQESLPLIIVDWQRKKPYHEQSLFMKYALQFRYTPVQIDKPNRDTSFFETSISLVQSLFLSADLPSLRTETIETGHCWQIVRIIMGPSPPSNWIISAYSRGYPSVRMRGRKPSRDAFQTQAKCFAVILLAAPEHIDWEWIGKQQRAISLEEAPRAGFEITEPLLRRLRLECRRHHCAYGMLSDGEIFAPWEYTPDMKPNAMSHEAACLDPRRIDQDSPVRLLTSMLFDEAYESGLCRSDLPSLDRSLPYQGALNKEHAPMRSGASVSGFDIYTMHHDESYFNDFMQWKANVRKEAQLRPVQVGDTLSVDVDGLFREISRWRSPLPSSTIPEDTREEIMRAPRLRDTAVDVFLSNNSATKVNFKVTAIVQSGVDKYSQVYFGRLQGVEHDLALKLVDERFIPSPPGDAFQDRKRKCELLLGVVTAEDMLRREEAVYEDKLKYLQGTMLPHCYGFHTFTLPDGWRAHGMLLEIIHGPAFHQIDIKPRELERLAAHIDMVKRARHVARAIGYAGIDYTDWHGGQILCPPTGGLREMEKFEYEFVCIDFAFAEQRFGEHIGCPPMYNLYRLLRAIAFDTKLNYWLGKEGQFLESWGSLDFPDEY